MADGSADDIAGYGHGGIRVALARENQLAQRATAQQDAAPTDKRHAKEVPNAIRMRHRLTGKGEVELSKDQVQFYLFYETLREFVMSATNASAHADRVVNSYTAKEQRNLVRQIAQKNGIAVFNNEYGNGNAFENNQSTQTTARQETRNEQPIESLFDPAGGSDDLPF